MRFKRGLFTTRINHDMRRATQGHRGRQVHQSGIRRGRGRSVHAEGSTCVQVTPIKRPYLRLVPSFFRLVVNGEGIRIHINVDTPSFITGQLFLAGELDGGSHPLRGGFKALLPIGSKKR